MLRKLGRGEFAERVGRIVKRVRWRDEGPEVSFAEAAAGCLRTVAEPFFEAAGGDLADLTALHCFRITAKHLRYSIEVFAAAIAPAFRSDVYPCIEEVQSRLGEVHDHAAAIERFQTWLAEWEDGPEIDALRELIGLERGELARTRQEFIRWWTPEQAADLRERFDRALAAQLARPGKNTPERESGVSPSVSRERAAMLTDPHACDGVPSQAWPCCRRIKVPLDTWLPFAVALTTWRPVATESSAGTGHRFRTSRSA